VLEPFLSLCHCSVEQIRALRMRIIHTAYEICQIRGHIISRLLAVFLEESAHDAVFSFKDFGYISSRCTSKATASSAS